jgi:flavin reductase (DIM6/NTAB) family NADH-FMN oxidoreductase RutF
MPADDTTYKTAMRLLAGGVTIVATRHNGQVSGLTATAVCSLALSPPRVLACVNHAGVTYELIAKSRIMSVNLLAEGQEELAQRFAAKRAAQTEDRFANTEWLTLVTGAPLLADGLAALDCRVTDIMPLDTHAILIGVVEDVHFGPRRTPLVHFDGGYTTVLTALTETTS